MRLQYIKSINLFCHIFGILFLRSLGLGVFFWSIIFVFCRIEMFHFFVIKPLYLFLEKRNLELSPYLKMLISVCSSSSLFWYYLFKKKKRWALSSLWKVCRHIMHKGFTFLFSPQIVNQVPKHYYCIIPKERELWGMCGGRGGGAWHGRMAQVPAK